MVRQKVDLKIVTTTKIQATVSDKKHIKRMWRLPVIVPAILKKHLESYLKDAKNEVLCATRTSSEWVDYIKSSRMSTEMRAWVTSVIWWHYGGKTDVLYKYYRSFDDIKPLISKRKLFQEQLDKMGISKVANESAAQREKTRELKLKKLLTWYERR